MAPADDTGVLAGFDKRPEAAQISLSVHVVRSLARNPIVSTSTHLRAMKLRASFSSPTKLCHQVKRFVAVSSSIE